MTRFTSTPRTFHVGISIAGALRQPDRELDGLIDSDGRELSGKEIKHLLFNLRQKNPELQHFTGDSCDNQDSTGSCQGHDIQLCKTCHGECTVGTGIAEAPSTICNACNGTGRAASTTETNTN